MAKLGAASVKTSKTPPKPSEKDKEKAAPKAVPEHPGKAPAVGKAPPKPGGKDPAGKPGALPDAALLDDEATGDAAAPPPKGLARWLPSGRKRWIVLGGGMVGLLVVIAAAAVAAAYLRPKPPPAAPSTTFAGRAQAVDGATLTVAGRTVHLEDIDAPPASLICRNGAWTYSCGADARRGLDAAIGPAPVECVHAHADGSGRLAALCFNDTGLDVAAIQVESGWAVDDIRTSSRYVAEEARAESDGKGLWRNDFAHPELWHNSPTAAAR